MRGFEWSGCRGRGGLCGLTGGFGWREGRGEGGKGGGDWLVVGIVKLFDNVIVYDDIVDNDIVNDHIVDSLTPDSSISFDWCLF